MCSGCRGRAGQGWNLSYFGLFIGASSFAVLSIAVFSQDWVYTREPITPPHQTEPARIEFSAGLWKACPNLLHPNKTVLYCKYPYHVH